MSSLPGAEPTKPEATTKRKPPPWKRAAVYVFVLALFAWVGRRMAADAGRVDWSNLVRDWRPLVLATLAWASIFVFRAWLWGEMMRRVGYRVGHVASARVFLASHLGRFLPGKVWSVVGAGIFGKQLGVPGAAAAVTMTVFLIIYYMVGSLMAMLVVWRLSEAHLWSAVAVAVLGVALLVFLATPWFPALLQWLGRKAKRDLDDLNLPSAGTLLLVAGGLAFVWAVAGAALMLMTRGILPADAPAMSLVDGIGTYASALVAGFAVLFAPAGLGVREAVMVELLNPYYGGAYAGIIAITSRLIVTSLELLLSLWGIWPYLRSRSRAPQARP